MASDAHRLREVLETAAHGHFSEADGGVEVLPPPPGPAMAVVALTGRFFVATSASPKWIHRELPAGDLYGPMSPRFLSMLGEKLGRRDDGIDILLAAPGVDGRADLEQVDVHQHPRVLRSAAHRTDVRVFRDHAQAAVLTIGSGLAGRTEIAIEVDTEHRDRGLARRVLLEARKLAPPSDALFAQIAPGNAASLRAFSAAGFKPIGSEVLFF